MEGKISHAEAIVVLGGGLRPNGDMGVSTRERIEYGIALFKQGLGNHLILSGGNAVSGCTEAEKMFREALKDGIPPKMIIKESKSSSTHENAIYTRKILLQYGIDGKVILITSPYHMRRALLCFEKEHIDVIPAPVKDSEIYIYGFYQDLRNMHLLLHEYLALFYYWLKGYV